MCVTISVQRYSFFLKLPNKFPYFAKKTHYKFLYYAYFLISKSLILQLSSTWFHLSPITYSLKEASYSAASYNLSSLAFYVHCPNYSGILLVFMAKSFPLGEDLGEASSPYTLHLTPYTNKVATFSPFICISAKISVTLRPI